MTYALRRAKYSFIFCLLLVFALTCPSFAQSIYGGGNGDGNSIGCFVQPDNPQYDIYGGGNANGFAIACFAQPDNVQYNIYGGGVAEGFSIGCFAQADNVLYNIYNGGNSEGFSINCFAQADNVLYNIYNGGNTEGFSINCFVQADNVLYNIYNGGNADGFFISCFVQPDNVLYNIYNGGKGDGFSVFCLGSIGGEVPLPVELINFEGKYQDHTVLLQWKTASELNNNYFGIERSKNGVDFISLYDQQAAGTTSQENSYSFVDENPFEGINYYRLKQVDVGGVFAYSPVITVYADGAGKPSLLIFPNPSDNNSIVQIQLEGIGEGTPVELTITNMYGQKVSTFSAETDANSQVGLPITFTSGLPSGVYVVSAIFSQGHLTAKWIVK